MRGASIDCVSPAPGRDAVPTPNDSDVGMSPSPATPRSTSSTPRTGDPRWVRCRRDQQVLLSSLASALTKKFTAIAKSSGDVQKKSFSYENVFDQLLEWSAPHVDEMMTENGPSEHSSGHGGLTYTQLNNLLSGVGMKEVRKKMYYNFFRDEGKGSRQWLRHVERVTQRSFDRVIARLRRSRDLVVILVDDRYDSSRDAQHCTVSAVDLKSGMLVGTKTMERGGESSWRLETQCVERLLQRLKDEKNLIIAEVVHDDCGAVGVVLRRMNIDSQKCMWHKAKALIKRLREAIRATKTVKSGAIIACEHMREVKCFTKKELKEWLDSRGVCVEAVGTKKKDELVELVWGVLFPDQAGKPLSDDVVEIDALETLHSNAAEEAKEWLYGACRLQKSVGDDDGDLLATHVQHLANHWSGDHSLCEKELPNLCKAAGGQERAALYENGGRVHLAISRCLQQFASNTKMAYYTSVRMTFNNECFHSVINKYATKRVNFPKSYEARV
ncbi:hypothetical protein CBR_g21171 [Chara braunii]|uniref:Uncharacterized protein n=1 Tax=Chara braunii TaxID=69332 RepID=A0A388L0U9_CHABU|nr:hypothetical protein CBR_g21171 [Chara braunii]|eukprot:GBG75929.1 hypothetical protein CBR_g21171 [Chara braunii]